MLLAGDAAHQTPPFAGQGLCSGLRDAANLAWKLDLVLRDLAPDALLDAYGLERGPNMRAVIELAIGMGELICVADPEEAAARDAAFIADDDGRLTDIPPFPPIAEGVVLAGSPCAGELFLQAEVEVDGRRSRFDDAVGAGWRLVTLADPRLDADLARLVHEHRWRRRVARLRAVAGRRRRGLRVVVRGPRRLVAALQRPDFAIYGTATPRRRMHRSSSAAFERRSRCRLRIDFRRYPAADGPSTARSLPCGGRLRGAAVRHPVRPPAAVRPGC